MTDDEFLEHKQSLLSTVEAGVFTHIRSTDISKLVLPARMHDIITEYTSEDEADVVIEKVHGSNFLREERHAPSGTKVYYL